MHIMADDEAPIALRRPRRDPTPAPPSMHCLHRPIRRGWGRTDWASWVEEDREFFRKNFRTMSEQRSDMYFEQKADAETWATPVSISLHVATPGYAAAIFEVAKSTRKTVKLHDIINEVCAAHGLDRRAHYWNLQSPPAPPRHETSSSSHPMRQPANVAPPSEDELRIQAQDKMRKNDEGCDGCRNGLAFPILWEPGELGCWADEYTFGPRVLIATPKPGPVRPTTAPDFSLLKSPPPESSATPEEWDAWDSANSSGSFSFWMQRGVAIQWRCPDVVTLSLQGIWHSLVVDVVADAPLQAALDAFLAAFPPGADKVEQHELILTHGGTGDPNDEAIDPQTTSARHLYTGARHTPKILKVIFWDEERRAAARLAKHGPTPDGQYAFRGSGYLLDETECDWYVTKRVGCNMYNSVIEAAELHDLSSGRGWEDMFGSLCGLLSRILTKEAPPTATSSVRVETSRQALDQLTAYLLATLLEDGWRRDPRGKIMLWSMDCRKLSISLMKLMDVVAKHVVGRLQEALAPATGADASSHHTPPGDLFVKAARALPKRQISMVPESLQQTVKRARKITFGPEQALAQAKLLFTKLAKEYKGYAQNAGGHHEGYHAFEKVLAIM